MFKSFLKFTIAAALIIWLTKSGKLDFSLLKKSIEIGPQWLIAMAIISLQAITTSFRFRLILQTKSVIKLKFIDIVRIGWIGQFFSSILPGAVTGDFIKLFYIKKLDPSFAKSFLVTAVMLDRILGLLGLLFISGVFSLFYYSEITILSPQIKHIIWINFLLFFGGTGFLFLLLLSKKIQKFILHFIFKIPKIGYKLTSALEHLFIFGNHRTTIFACFVLSICTQFMTILAFWTITAPFHTTALPFTYAFTFIPIGLIAVALPISPGGLGVGHALFQNLFSLVGILNGASLFNLFFIGNISVNLFGVIPYLMAGKRPSETELQSFT